MKIGFAAVLSLPGGAGVKGNMGWSYFCEKEHPPTPKQLSAALGSQLPLWREMVTKLGRRFKPVSREWVFGGKNYGWSLRLKRGARAILYLTPRDGSFSAGLCLGEKAVAAGRDALSFELLQLIDQAPRYPEGRGIRLEIRGRCEIDSMVALAKLKMAS